jgi:hypothetical protein
MRHHERRAVRVLSRLDARRAPRIGGLTLSLTKKGDRAGRANCDRQK